MYLYMYEYIYIYITHSLYDHATVADLICKK